MSSQRRFFSGDSLAQALAQAAQHFQLPPAEIEYATVEKRHGFLKVRRKVVIAVDEANPRRADAEPAAEAPAAAEPRETFDAPPVDEHAARDAAAPREVEAAPRPAEDVDPPVEAKPEPEPETGPEADDPHPGDGDRNEGWAVANEEDEFRSEEPAERPRDEEGRGAGAAAESSSRPKRRRGRRGRGAGSNRVELADAPPAAQSRFPLATGEEAEAAAEALDKILKLAGLVVESEIFQADEHLQIELRGADQDLLLRDRGRLLLAIQHLLPRVVRGLIGRSVLCRVDSDNYHEIREERLRDMAQRAADEVRHKGRPKTLEPMSPDERRIVHLTLADYPGVETESHGSGLFKRVMVRSARSGSRDSYRR